MVEKTIGLKGTSFTLSVLHMINGNLDEIRTYLEDKISLSPAFFKGAPLVLNMENMSGDIKISSVVTLMRELELIPVGATGMNSDKLRRSAERAGLAIVRSGAEMKEQAALCTESKDVDVTRKHSQEKIHIGNVRSGQQVRAENGSLIIIGSVSPGADVMARDSIHIYGALRGRAVAGINGNEDARIFCTKFYPELVSVSGHYQISDGLKDQDIDKKVSVYLKDGQLTIEHII